MNKKSVFDKHLYKEGLRALLPFGAILLGLLSVFSLLYTTGSLLHQSDYNSFEDLYTMLIGHHTVLYFAIIVLVVPILSLKSFHFLTTRNGSDFYHSIPHKKQCLFITFALAILTWVSLCTLVPATITTVAFQLTGNTIFSFGDFIVVVLHILVAALLVMSAISIGCAITGTMLTNIIASGLILFFPRVFLYACRLILSELTYYFLPGNGFLFGTRCNLVVQSIIGFENCNYYLFNYKPLIYTFLLCIVYILLAVFLFERRHSELAMKPTLSRRLQAFICLLLGTSFSIVPIALICVICSNSWRDISDYAFILVTLYTLIIIAMGIYELLSTKKAKNLIHIIPRTGILAVINLMLIGSLFAGKELILSNIPNASAIKSVSFAFTNPDCAELFYMYPNINSVFSVNNASPSMDFMRNDYFENKANLYNTSDEAVRKIIAKGLENASDLKNPSGATIKIIVNVNTGFRTMRRTAYLEQADYTALLNELLNDNKFVSIYRDLPKTDKISLSYQTAGVRIGKNELSELYQLAREEIATLDFEKITSILSESVSNSVDALTFTSTVNSMHVSSHISISPALPKTYEKYLTMVNQKSVDMLKNAKAELDKQEDNSDRYELEYDIIANDELSIDSYNGYISSHISGNTATIDFIDDMIQLENGVIDPQKKNCSLIRVTFSTYNSHGNTKERKVKYIQMENATLKHHCDTMNNGDFPFN